MARDAALMLSIVASFSVSAAIDPAVIRSLSPDAFGSPMRAFTESLMMLTVAAPAKNQPEEKASVAASDCMVSVEFALTFTAPVWVMLDHSVSAVVLLPIS